MAPKRVFEEACEDGQETPAIKRSKNNEILIDPNDDNESIQNHEQSQNASLAANAPRTLCHESGNGSQQTQAGAAYRVSPRSSTKAPVKSMSTATKHKDVHVQANRSATDAFLKKLGKEKKSEQAQEERRLKSFRKVPPRAYMDIHHRAVTQRMFVINRTRSGSEEYPKETIELAGTTGNIYTVRIHKVPNCDCPYAQKGHQCKHIIYVMAKVLRARKDLQYQLALLSSELREIFANAPPILSENNTGRDGNRKPIEGDCAICCSEFRPAEEIVWCQAACGNNIHKDCFSQWAATRGGKSGGVTCPFCRTPWMGDEDMLKTIARTGKKNAEGYVNVAPELGLSGQRDYSTYNSHWVRRQQRAGVDVGEWEDFSPDDY